MTSLKEVDNAFHWQLVLIERTHSVVRQSGIDMAIKKYDDSEDGDDLDRCNRLDVAKCNLGKVNLEIMLVSSFSSCTGGGPMPLAGAPRDLNMQLLSCRSSQSVFAIACCLCAILSLVFSYPSLPRPVNMM